jgi:hypothetical protein
MLLRRLARLLLAAFIAGPVLNVACLLPCVKAGVLTSSETCHQSTGSDAVSSEQGCAEPQAALSPFLKTNESLQVAVVGVFFHADHGAFVAVSYQASVIEPGTRPSGSPSPLVPLRI